MKKKKYNKIGLWALLLLLFVGLVSCSQEELPDSSRENNKNLIVNMKVGDFYTFSLPDTRAIGTPDAGKSKWEVGDKVFVEITLHEHHNYSTVLHVEYLTYRYNGSSWDCIFGNEKIATVKDNLGNTIPFRYTTYVGYYNPAYDWFLKSDNQGYELRNSGVYTEAVNEAFRSKVFENYITLVANSESIDFTIDFQEEMIPRKYSRIRVVAAPNVGVSLSGVKLRSSWIMAISKNALLDDSYKARTVTDSNGNAFFYYRWDNPTPLTIETYVVATGAQIKKNVVTTFMGSVVGKS